MRMLLALYWTLQIVVLGEQKDNQSVVCSVRPLAPLLLLYPPSFTFSYEIKYLFVDCFFQFSSKKQFCRYYCIFLIYSLNANWLVLVPSLQRSKILHHKQQSHIFKFLLSVTFTVRSFVKVLLARWLFVSTTV